MNLKKILKNLKISNCTGYDSIPFKIIKKCGYTIAPHITHIINNIINTGTFPDILKIARLLPLSKPGKPDHLISPYRPINTLCAIEKVIEVYMKSHLIQYLEENYIINSDHHGGLKDYSTTTAMASVYNTLYYNMERGDNTAIITTDLSAAYDTVDNDILLQKLEYYGISGNELKLFRSYLYDRKQYVMLDTFPSSILKCPPCGVVQGSKLSGILYNIYVNELPNLHNLMSTDTFNNITGKISKTYNVINHKTINYVDDSTNMVTFRCKNDISKYI